LIVDLLLDDIQNLWVIDYGLNQRIVDVPALQLSDLLLSAAELLLQLTDALFLVSTYSLVHFL